jgi:putative oxidoreductase
MESEPGAVATGNVLTQPREERTGRHPLIRVRLANRFIVVEFHQSVREVAVMLRRLTQTTATWGTVPLRLALGGIFIGHGLQKVLGSFGGPGLAKFASFPTPFPTVMRPAWLWMGVAAVSELGGGILVLLGLFTRIGAFLIAFTMIVAIVGVHWPAFFAPAGMELPLALLGMSLALLIMGGGQASVDRMIGGRRSDVRSRR